MTENVDCNTENTQQGARKYQHTIVFPILTIFKCEFSGIKYIHNVQPSPPYIFITPNRNPVSMKQLSLIFSYLILW